MQNRETLNFRIQREDNLNEVVFEDIAGPGNGRHHYQIFKAGATDTVASPYVVKQEKVRQKRTWGSR